MLNLSSQYIIVNGWLLADKMKKFFNLAALAVLGVAIFFFSDKGIAAMKSISEDKTTIVIDVGHGGADPGKVGINGALEKDVNLSVALYLRELLVQNDIEVILTRDADEGLYTEEDRNKKTADLKQRVEIINAENVDFAVSIHQNSYTEEYVHGAQVFYHEQSEEGKQLADFIQKQFVKSVDPENNRQIKANNSYYLLKKTAVPIVIVECGFLSNYAEAEKLVTEEYQDRVAWAIYMGVMNYLNNGT